MSKPLSRADLTDTEKQILSFLLRSSLNGDPYNQTRMILEEEGHIDPDLYADAVVSLSTHGLVDDSELKRHDDGSAGGVIYLVDKSRVQAALGLTSTKRLRLSPLAAPQRLAYTR